MSEYSDLFLLLQGYVMKSWPRVWLLDVLDFKKVITLFALCILAKKSFVFFPLHFRLEYIKAMRNKHEADHSIHWMPSWHYLMSLVYFFLNPHSSSQARTNMSAWAQHIDKSITFCKRFIYVICVCTQMCVCVCVYTRIWVCALHICK